MTGDALGDLTPAQRRLLAEVARAGLAGRFYLSGGTALASQYLHHRQSLDLDLFSPDPVDSKRIVGLLDGLADGPIIPRRVQDRLEFTVPLLGEWLRVAFVHYDFPALERRTLDAEGVPVDGLRDLLANRLSCLVERAEPKDFADVLFLLRVPGLTLAGGMDDCHAKFRWPGLRVLLQTAFLRIDRVAPDAWPRTSPPVSLDEARAFFHALARSLIELD